MNIVELTKKFETKERESLKGLFDPRKHSLSISYIGSVDRPKLTEFAVFSNLFNINSIDHVGGSLLYHLCSLPEKMFPKVIDLIKIIIDADFQIDMQYNIEYIAPPRMEKGYTCLMKAAQCNSIEIVKLLLVNGADTTLLNKNHESAKDIAIRRGRDEVVNLL